MANDKFVPEINTLNEFMLVSGRNLPNHTMSMQGKGQYVQVGRGAGTPLCFRTKQEIYRFCAWALTLGVILPDEDGSHEFEEVLEAVQNS